GSACISVRSLIRGKRVNGGPCRPRASALLAPCEERAPLGYPAGREELVSRRFLPLTADNAARDADTFREHQVEPLTVPMWPHDTDFDPLRFAIACLSRVDDDVGDMGRLVAHDALLSLPRPPQPGLDAARPRRGALRAEGRGAG